MRNKWVDLGVVLNHMLASVGVRNIQHALVSSRTFPGSGNRLKFSISKSRSKNPNLKNPGKITKILTKWQY